MYNRIKYLILFGALVGLMACGDDSSTGPDPSKAPSLPEVQSEQAQPDLSFFEDNQPKILAKGDTANYYEARNWVTLQSSTFAFAGAYSGFLMAGNQEDATYEDGVWVWEYSYAGEEGSFSIRLTSEEVPGGYEWAMYWSFDDGETSVEDYLVMEGIVAEDGSEGEWTLNSLNQETDQEQIAYTSEWSVTSDTEKEMTIKYYNESGTATLTAGYDENKPDHTMVFTYPNDPNTTLYWNTDTNKGYIERGGEKSCWDENFADVPCS